MSFNIAMTMRALESKLAASGYFQHVQIGEPKAPPSQRFTAALFMLNVAPWLTLRTLCAVHVVNLRIYDNMLREPAEDVELEMSLVVDKVMDDLAGEFDLGGTISHVDIGGEKGTALGAKWGYVDVSGTMFRIADIVIPLVVNDVATLVA